MDQMPPSENADGQEGFALMVRDKVWEAGTVGSCMSNLISVAGIPSKSGKSNDFLGIRGFTGIIDSEDGSVSDIVSIRKTMSEEEIDNGMTYRLSLEKTDSAYIATQYDPKTDEVISTETYYIPAKDRYATSIRSYEELDDPLSCLEEDKAYVALVTARGMNATFNNIEFSTSAWNASGWNVQPEVLIDPKVSIKSSETTADGTYNLTFKANADGTASILRDDNVIVSDIKVTADTLISQVCDMAGDSTDFAVEFTPKEGYSLSAYEKLSSYETITAEQTVTQADLGTATTIYVSAEGKSTNDGTSMENAVDIQTALNYAKPGQTILLKSETYEFTDSLKIDRGRSGTEEKHISITTEDGKFATFDFMKESAGFVVNGDCWDMSFINIKRSTGKGLYLAGSHNTLSRMNFYNNADSGLQISGSSEYGKEYWPSYNEIINCTSINNADKALEDADGFAPKLTTGEGNVFEGCIAAYNADDGWDLFAKQATGTIGPVEIRNCIAYKNGFIMVEEGSTKKDFTLAEVVSDEEGNLTFANGEEMEAGNGIGYKMGGSNLPGAHILSGSAAFDNRYTGIDSNYCPDIKVYNCISYNNGDSNISLFTGKPDAVTAFEVSDVISFRKETNGSDYIVLKEQKSEESVFNASNYFWDEETNSSKNTEGEVITDDMFISLDTSSVYAPAVLGRDQDGNIERRGLLELR